jgi:hypothetical protein
MDGQDRRPRLVFRSHELRRRPANLRRVTDHQRDEMLVVQDLVFHKQRLVLAADADVVVPGHIRRRQHRAHARHGPRLGYVELDEARVRMRRANRPHIEHRAALGHVIDVLRAAGDVPRAALVRQRARFRLDLPRRAVDECPARVLRPVFAAHEFFPQATDNPTPIFRAAAPVGKRSEFLA